MTRYIRTVAVIVAIGLVVTLIAKCTGIYPTPPQEQR